MDQRPHFCMWVFTISEVSSQLSHSRNPDFMNPGSPQPLALIDNQCRCDISPGDQLDAAAREVGSITQRALRAISVDNAGAPLDQPRSRIMPRRSAIETSSTSVRALVFSITLRRCALTVRSAMPNSSAICLFSLPRTTSPKT
jgi:hypothetical protein